MDKYKDFRKSGLFKISSDVEVPGELSLKGGATSLDLYSNLLFSTHASQDIVGVFHDRSKVSLINCITTSGPGNGTRGNDSYHFSSVFPHFALFGDEYLTSADRKIVEVSFAVDDATTIFYDFDAFGSVINARPHMERIVEAKEGGRTIEIGEHPHLFYFTGKHDIFSADTVLGKISATHGISYSFPGPNGIHVQNTIRLNINFPNEQSVETTIRAVIDTLRFLEVVAGRPQNIVDMAFRLTASTDERPRILDAYWSLPPRRNKDDESTEPHPADLPLQAGIDPNKFTTVLIGWLARHDEWRNARTRHATASAYQNRYNTDRLIGAANMFDIMPASACPTSEELSPALKDAKEAARKAFKILPSSPERDSVLNALGRIGTPSLKRKVRSRVKLIMDAVGTKFPSLDLIADQAVDCRNYYVHGTPGKFSYEVHSVQPIFFTDTLEFVFAASDLIEAGWDIAEWIKQGTTMSHPFGRYCVDYAARLSELRKLLT
ncbi:MAG: HEPN domain-containing protein [Betaproteobacteria bacterium]